MSFLQYLNNPPPPPPLYFTCVNPLQCVLFVAEEAGQEAEGLEPEPGVPRLLDPDVLLEYAHDLRALGQRQEVLQQGWLVSSTSRYHTPIQISKGAGVLGWSRSRNFGPAPAPAYLSAS